MKPRHLRTASVVTVLTLALAGPAVAQSDDPDPPSGEEVFVPQPGASGPAVGLDPEPPTMPQPPWAPPDGSEPAMTEVADVLRPQPPNSSPQLHAVSLPSTVAGLAEPAGGIDGQALALGELDVGGIDGQALAPGEVDEGGIDGQSLDG